MFGQSACKPNAEVKCVYATVRQGEGSTGGGEGIAFGSASASEVTAHQAMCCLGELWEQQEEGCWALLPAAVTTLKALTMSIVACAFTQHVIRGLGCQGS